MKLPRGGGRHRSRGWHWSLSGHGAGGKTLDAADETLEPLGDEDDMTSLRHMGVNRVEPVVSVPGKNAGDIVHMDPTGKHGVHAKHGEGEVFSRD